MKIYARGEDRMPRSMGLLVSMLMRYPELAAVHYEPEDDCLRLTFLIKMREERTDFNAFEALLKDSVDTLCRLEGKRPKRCSCTVSSLGQLSALEITRDVESLSREELSLLVTLVREEYDEILEYEEPDGLAEEEDPYLHDELISEMLDDLRETKHDRRLFAIREEDCVLVFNK